MSVGWLLTLPGGREARYWEEASTKQRILRFDYLALSASVVVNLLLACFNLRALRRRAVTIIITSQLQLAQVLWLTLSPAIYGRHRETVTILQQLRWTVNLAKLMRNIPTQGVVRLCLFGHAIQPGTLVAFVAVACLYPM
jgi:hypothetical protein